MGVQRRGRHRKPGWVRRLLAEPLIAFGVLIAVLLGQYSGAPVTAPRPAFWA